MRLLSLLLVLVAGCLPPPGPGPDPSPDPEPRPTPIDESAWLIVIEESAERTPAVAEVLRTLPALRRPFRVYDDDSEEAQQYVDAVSQVRKPALLILRPGKRPIAMPLPEHPEQLKRIVGDL